MPGPGLAAGKVPGWNPPSQWGDRKHGRRRARENSLLSGVACALSEARNNKEPGEGHLSFPLPLLEPRHEARGPCSQLAGQRMGWKRDGG